MVPALISHKHYQVVDINTSAVTCQGTH